MNTVDDAAPFDSVPGIGFDTDPTAAAIVPPPGTIAGRGQALAVDPAQNNAYRAINKAWKTGGEIQFKAGSADGGARFLIRGLTEAAQADLVRALALTAERTDAVGTPVKKPRLGLFQPWSGSLDEGWTRWVLEQYGFEFAVLHPEDFHKPLGDQVDVIILADDARVPLENASGPAAGNRGGGAPRVVRPEYAYALSADDLKGLETFIRSGGGARRSAARRLSGKAGRLWGGHFPLERIRFASGDKTCLNLFATPLRSNICTNWAGSKSCRL